jgi:hypothetical protein
MEEQKPMKDLKGKEYQSQESQSCTAKEPEVLSEVKSDTQSFEEDFDRALARAITGEELLQRMYKRIDAWPWKNR